MSLYVNRKNRDESPVTFVRRRDGSKLYRYNETVDEVVSRREARYLVGEYRMADPAGAYWISTRPCANWREG